MTNADVRKTERVCHVINIFFGSPLAKIQIWQGYALWGKSLELKLETTFHASLQMRKQPQKCLS